MKKFERKGWSQDKIARWMENRQKVAKRANLLPEFRSWLADAVQECEKAYLLVHWDLNKLDLESTTVLMVDEFQKEETYIRDEQLFLIKSRYDSRI